MPAKRIEGGVFAPGFAQKGERSQQMSDQVENHIHSKMVSKPEAKEQILREDPEIDRIFNWPGTGF